MKKKIVLHSELVFLFAVVILAFSVAMLSAVDFGVSMIVAPAYLLSMKVSFLTFGQAEYVLQGILFIVFCILMKKVKAVYFMSFVTCIIYGFVLDMFRAVIPAFNPEITPPGSFPMYARIIMFVVGMVVTSLSIAMFFKTYLYPQVYDFFVKSVSGHFNLDRTKFKRIYDASSLTVSVIMSFALFGGFKGIGWGTLIMTVLNGMIIGFFDKMLDKFFVVKPIFPKVGKMFDI